MYQANTMAGVGEALRMSLLGSASKAPADRRRDYCVQKEGQAVVKLVERGRTAWGVLTIEGLETEIAVGMAPGWVPNIELHLKAFGGEPRILLPLDDFNTITHTALPMRNP